MINHPAVLPPTVLNIPQYLHIVRVCALNVMLRERIGSVGKRIDMFPNWRK